MKNTVKLSLEAWVVEDYFIILKAKLTTRDEDVNNASNPKLIGVPSSHSLAQPCDNNSY